MDTNAGRVRDLNATCPSAARTELTRSSQLPRAKPSELDPRYAIRSRCAGTRKVWLVGRPGAQRTIAFSDQIVSSLTNFAPGFYAAHALIPRDFAVFGLLQVAYVLGLGVTRALFSSVALVSESSTLPTRQHQGAVDAVAATSISGCAVAAFVVVPFVAAPSSVVLLSVAGLAVALVQDAVRFTSIATHHAGQALSSDSAWLVAVLVSLSLIHGPHPHASPWFLASVWLWSSAVGLAIGAVATRWSPSAKRGWWFVRQQPRLSASFLTEWSLKQGAATVATYAIGAVGGALATAGIRASQLVLGPMNVLFTGFQLALLPAVVAARDRDLLSMRRTLRVASIALFAAPLTLAGAALLVPEAWLRILVGAQAQGVITYTAPLALSLAATGLMTGSLTGLRVLKAGREMVRTRIIASVGTLAAGCIGLTMTGTVLGGLWGLAFGGLISVLPWELAFRRRLQRALTTQSGHQQHATQR